MNSNVNRMFSIINGQKLQYINRTCDMVCIGFGDIFSRKNARGQFVNCASYALHLQCPFRIIKHDRVVVGSDDLFLSLSPENEAVDLSTKDSTQFDYKIKKLFQINNDIYVCKSKVTAIGDVELSCNLFDIQVLNVNSNGDESWRFFRVNSQERHLVATGLGIDLE